MTDMALSADVSRHRARGVAAIPCKLAAEVVAGSESYVALADEWRRLSEMQDRTALFQLPGLLAPWARHFGKGSATPVTIVVRDESRPVMIWPLAIERRALVKVATGAGGPIGQYDEILIDPDYDVSAAFAVAIEALKARFRPDLLFLERVRADSSLREALRDVAPICWAEGAPYSDLSRGVAGLKKELKSRVVRQQKKRVRRLAEEGEIAFEVAADPSMAQAWLSEAMSMKREWLKSTGRVSRAFMRPATAACLAEMAWTLARPAASPRMVVSRLSVNGRTAAIEMGFRHRESYHLYLGAFAPEYARLGPGNVLTEHVLDWCAKNGLSRYDMLPPRSRNKGEWQSGEVAVLDFAMPLSARGRLYSSVMLKHVAPTFRRIFYALPPSVRSTIAGRTLRI